MSLSQLDKPGRTVLTVHNHPDSDSVASNLMFADVLEEFNYTVDIFSADPIPESLSFLPGFERIKKLPEDFDWKQYDYYVALDMSSADRSGITKAIPEGMPVIVIDHHVTNSGWGTENIIDTEGEYPSTCSMLYAFFKEMGLRINPDRATLLLAGICGDTGFFQYTGSNLSMTLKQTAELLESGARFEEIRLHMLNSMDVSDLAFISEALSSVEVHNQFAIMTVNHEIWSTKGKAHDKNDYAVYYLPKIEGTEGGVLLIEEEKSVIRVSFRSRNEAFDVSEIAKKLGGGGHKNAAGATLKNISLKEAVEKVKAAL